MKAEWPSVLHFRRDSSWESMTNFGTEPVALPSEEVLVASGPVDNSLRGETAIWFRR